MVQCPFPNCGKVIRGDLFACGKHWLSLTADQQAAIWQAYRSYSAGILGLDDLLEIQAEVLTEATGVP